MTSLLGTRRKPRVIALGDGGDEEPGLGKSPPADEKNEVSIRWESHSSSRSSSKIRKKKSSRISFGPGGTSMTEEEEDQSTIFTPKKSNLSRQAIEKNALRKSLGVPLASDSVPLRQTDDRPSYSAEHLNELKSSTPSTPKNLDTAWGNGNEESKALDLATKFGSDLSVYDNSAIPTDAVIREKKERRARLAKEQEYINLHGADESDDDRNEISLRPRKDYPESRLVRDDEDIAEGFDEYVDDGRIALGRKAEREQRRKQQSEMETLIKDAEGGSSSDEMEDSEVERRQAYEVAQTRAGLDGLQKTTDYDGSQRPRTPPKITPLPTLNACLEKLQASLTKMQYEKIQRLRRLEEVRKEKLEMTEREVDIQRMLREAGENYERLRGQIGGELAAATTNGRMLENVTMTS